MFRTGDTPVSGYTLLGLLGRGQYGEVWEATGPGGTRLAVKFISLAENKGRIELKSIQSVKLIRHANLIPINAIWLLDRQGKVLSDDEAAQAMALSQKTRSKTQTIVADDQPGIRPLGYLVICMAKADGSLEQRLERAIEAGHSGIDPMELARYMREAASGLDFLNSPQHLVHGEMVGIQHRDIKPANLLLMGDTVVVGDFGVSTTVREFDAMMTAVVGSLAFMAPESLSQKTSPTSDQYALAITYYQLRCNQLPYDGTAPLDEIISIHKDGLLEFDLVSEAERKVLRRATAIDPHDRYESCREFAEAIADSLRPTRPLTETVVRSAFPVLPVVGGLAALVAIATFLIIDPAGWFRKPVVPPAPSARDVVLTFVPAEITGTIEITRADAALPKETQALSGHTNLQLFPDDSVTIKTQSENPFLGSIDQEYSTAQLEEMEWRIELPKIPSEGVLGRIDQMLDENKTVEATVLYAQAAKFETSLRSPPSSTELNSDEITQFAIDPASGAIAVAIRPPKGDDAASIVRFENGKLTLVAAPKAGGNGTLIEAFAFSESGNELFVIRQQGILRWKTENNSVQTLTESESGDSTGRWMFGRSSANGSWFAAADTQGLLRVWNLSESASTASPFSHTFDDRIINLMFDSKSQRLTIVTESVPVFQIDLSSGLMASLAVTEAKAQPRLENPVFVQAIPVSTDSMVIATENGLTIGPDFLTASPGTFTELLPVSNGTVSRAIGSKNNSRFIIESDGDPSALIYDLSNPKVLAMIGTERAQSIRDSTISPDGQWAVIAAYDGSLGLMDLRTEKPRWIPFQKLVGTNFRFVGFSGEGKHLIAVSTTASSPATSKIHVWNFRRCWLAWDSNPGLN